MNPAVILIGAAIVGIGLAQLARASGVGPGPGFTGGTGGTGDVPVEDLAVGFYLSGVNIGTSADLIAAGWTLEAVATGLGTFPDSLEVLWVRPDGYRYRQKNLTPDGAAVELLFFDRVSTGRAGPVIQSDRAYQAQIANAYKGAQAQGVTQRIVRV